MDGALPVIAGGLSTGIFLASMLPMLVKAGRTKDLASYSLGNIALSNVGNVVHSVYVFSLPVGPIWVLHSCYLVGAALMLFWYLRHGWRVGRTTHHVRGRQIHGSAEAVGVASSLAS